jgi:hypothetical protein
MTDDIHDLERAFRALAVLVKAEYPENYSLSQIIREWGPDFGLSSADADVVKGFESLATD